MLCYWVAVICVLNLLYLIGIIVKQLQQAELDQMHQDNANITALAAIGPRRSKSSVSRCMFNDAIEFWLPFTACKLYECCSYTEHGFNYCFNNHDVLIPSQLVHSQSQLLTSGIHCLHKLDPLTALKLSNVDWKRSSSSLSMPPRTVDGWPQCKCQLYVSQHGQCSHSSSSGSINE